MQAPACHPNEAGSRPGREAATEEGIWGAETGKGEERRWRRGRVLIGGDSRLLSLEAEAEKAVTGCLGHGRFASVWLVTGISPKATGARAFADADAWWRATSREATAIVRGRRSGAHTRAGWNRGRGVGPGSYGGGEARQESGFGIPNP